MQQLELVAEAKVFDAAGGYAPANGSADFPAAMEALPRSA